MPQEKVTELWGFNTFCSVSLSWAPPAIFIALNQGTGSLRLGLLATCIFLFVGLCIAVFIPERVVAGGIDEEEGGLEKTVSQTEETAVVKTHVAGTPHVQFPNLTNSIKASAAAAKH